MDFWLQNQNRSSLVSHHPPEVATIGKNKLVTSDIYTLSRSYEFHLLTYLRSKAEDPLILPRLDRRGISGIIDQIYAPRILLSSPMSQ